MKALSLAISWATATVLVIALALTRACGVALFIWLAWNYGVAMIGRNLPYAQYWACVAIALGIGCIAELFRARIEVKKQA